MSIPITKLKAFAINVYSPYTGAPVWTEGGPAEKPDDSVLFTYVDEAGEWEHVNPRLLKALGADREELDDLEVHAVCKKLKLDGAFCLEFDQGWSGVMYVAFAPPETTR